MQMAWLSARRGDFSDLHGRFQHLSLSAHVPICHFNRAGKKLPLNSLAQVLGVKSSRDVACKIACILKGGAASGVRERLLMGVGVAESFQEGSRDPQTRLSWARVSGDGRRPCSSNPKQSRDVKKRISFNLLTQALLDSDSVLNERKRHLQERRSPAIWSQEFKGFVAGSDWASLLLVTTVPAVYRMLFLCQTLS